MCKYSLMIQKLNVENMLPVTVNTISTTAIQLSMMLMAGATGAILCFANWADGMSKNMATGTTYSWLRMNMMANVNKEKVNYNW